MQLAARALQRGVPEAVCTAGCCWEFCCLAGENLPPAFEQQSAYVKRTWGVKFLSGVAHLTFCSQPGMPKEPIATA